MSNQLRKAAPTPNFEEAMKRLEQIVELMESPEMALEDLIARYEEGMKLVKICQERLAAAEKRIEIITRDSSGKTIVKEFESSAVQTAPPTESKGESINADVSLF
jgi:exodeoxyribonuclease VII small subunit